MGMTQNIWTTKSQGAQCENEAQRCNLPVHLWNLPLMGLPRLSTFPTDLLCISKSS